MKICDSWLREWIDHGLDAGQLAERLTMLGLEVDALTTIGTRTAPLKVGRVVEAVRHPNADRLSLCRVDVGTGEPLRIVCGASNVRAGGHYVVALPGAELPGGLKIRATSIRGEASAGMLCSASELDLDADAPGLLELDASAVPGSDANAVLQLGDALIDINITPNRADCLSIAGIAREVAAAGTTALALPECAAVEAQSDARFPVRLPAPEACSRFAGRVIRGIDARVRSPSWLAERLRRCGVRPIHPVVDVTNYVMLELGQPMHAYDLGALHDAIEVRLAQPGESLTLLGGRVVSLDSDMLVIADARGPIGLAGIMGGEASGVGGHSRDVFLESAFFAPAAIAGRARRLGLHTDASLRFERGVDPALQARAIERATRLILDIAGGEPGPLVDTVDAMHVTVRPPVQLRRARLSRVLGVDIADQRITEIFARLGMKIDTTAEGWSITPPSARFDVYCEEDLIEEAARVHGYGQIPETPGTANVRPARSGELTDPLSDVRTMLVARGFQEAITYSFVAPDWAHRFGAEDCPALTLSNPISAELAVMRQSLWPGLVRAVLDNRHRQSLRVRLFEIGTRFLPGAGADAHREDTVLAAVACGRRLPEQWGSDDAEVDVFDLKADLQAVLRLAGVAAATSFEPAVHPALHPGRCARVLLEERPIGWLGEIHPQLAAQWELPGAVLFEIEASAVTERRIMSCRAPSRFPAVRRDLAVVVARGVAVASLLEEIRRAAGSVLQEAFVFDIYTGPQIADTQKSVAIGLILQDTSRTLTDADADAVLHASRSALARTFEARIRE